MSARHPKRLAASAVLFIATLAAAAYAAAPAPKGNTMLTPAEAASMLQQLGPPLFQGSAEALTHVELAAARSDFRGLAVAVPPQLASDTASAVPVVLLSQQTVLRAWQVSEQYNLMLAVTDVDTGAVRITRALVDAKDGESRDSSPPQRPPAPTGAAAAGVSTKVHRLEVRIPPGHTATLAVAAMSFDRVSNTAVVALAGSRPKAAATVRAINPRPSPAPGLPTYAATSRSPKPPQLGLEFGVEVPPGAAGITVFGAFAKPLAGHELLRATQAMRDNGVDRQATAVVPLTVAVLGLDWQAPRMHTLAVPVYGAPDLPIGQRMSGYFDAPVPLGMALPAGEYVAYVLMDGVPHGPHKFRVP